MLYSPTVAAEFFIWKSTTRAHDRRTEKHFIFKPGFLKVNHAHNKHIFTIFANQRHTIPAKKTINKHIYLHEKNYKQDARGRIRRNAPHTAGKRPAARRLPASPPSMNVE